MTDRLMTTAQAAAYLGSTPASFRKFVRRHGIPVLRLGRVFRFRRADLDRWLRAETTRREGGR